MQCMGPVLTYDINITIALLESLFQTNINFHKNPDAREKRRLQGWRRRRQLLNHCHDCLKTISPPTSKAGEDGGGHFQVKYEGDKRLKRVARRLEKRFCKAKKQDNAGGRRGRHWGRRRGGSKLPGGGGKTRAAAPAF